MGAELPTDDSSFHSLIMFGATIETNRNYNISKAPPVIERAQVIGNISKNKTMITIEPIFDFDLDEMLELIHIANPDWINIGADSKRNNIPEPDQQKIKSLIDSLNCCDVKVKTNLRRLKRIYNEKSV